MARRLCLALGLVAVSTTTMATTLAAPLCPRGLTAVLDSPACRGHRLHMVNAPRTTIDASSVGDVCLDSLRGLLTSAASMPCSAHLASTPRADTRRLSDDGPFKGKLNCTFDTSAPLDLSNLNRSFIIDCKEIEDPYNYLWVYIVVGVIGGIAVVFGLLAFVPWAINEVKDWLKTRRERRRQEAIDKAEAPPAGHPYALA